MALSPSIPTSFVPKQPIASGPRRSSTGGGLFMTVALVIAGIAICAAGATFLYSKYLQSVEQAKGAQLLAAQKKVDPDTVEQFVRLRDRLVASNTILNKHVALSQFFRVFEGIALESVRFDSLNMLVANDRTAQIKLVGEARNFNALAAESTAFAGQKYIKSAIFSDIKVNTKDNSVAFSIEANIDSRLIIESTAPTSVPANAVPTNTNTPANTNASLNNAVAPTPTPTPTPASTSTVPDTIKNTMIMRLFPLFAIIFAIALFFGYISPTYNGEIAKSKQKIASYDSALAAADAFTKRENELIAERNAIPAASLARLETYLPNGVDNVQLILDLNALASRSGVTLSDFKVDDGKAVAGAAAPTVSATTPTTGSSAPTTLQTPSGVGTVTSSLQSSNLTDTIDLSVSATGTYGSFQSFLAAAEQSLRPLDVTKMTIKDSATGVYTYNVTFRIYWLH